MIAAFSLQLGVKLGKRKLHVEDCSVEIDGYGTSEDGTVHLAEAWAHVGKAKGSQPKKVLADVLKLAFTADALEVSNPNIRVEKHLLFADATAARVVQGEKWGAAAARLFDIRLNVIGLAQELREALVQTQRDQNIQEPSIPNS